MLRQIGFEENEALIPNDNQLFRGFDFLRDYFAFPRRFLGFDLIGLDTVAARLNEKTNAKTIDIHRRLRRSQFAACRGGAQGIFRALRLARGQPVREDPGSHSRPIQPVRVPGHPRPQPVARFRDEPGGESLRPYSRRAAESAGRTVVLGDRGAQRHGPQLHDPSPAPTAHDRRKEIWAGFRLCRNGRVPVARRALRSRRAPASGGTQRRRPMHQPPPGRTSSRRRKRRRFSFSRRRRIGLAMPGRTDARARARVDRLGGKGAGRFDRRCRLASREHVEPQSPRARRARGGRGREAPCARR